MKRPMMIFLLLAFLLIAAPLASADCIHVTQTTMEFHGTDAVFTLDYRIDFLAKAYIWALGSAKIVPAVVERFESFDNVTIDKLDYEQAVVTVKNVSHYDEGYYFHNSHDFGMTIEKLVVKPPDGASRTYWNTNVTPIMFYEEERG